MISKVYEGFKLDVDEVAWITFDRPGVNVFSTPVIEDFVKAIETLHAFKEVKVIVVTGEGKTFLAGADIKEMSSFTPADAMKFARLFHHALDLVEGFPRPVIAAVNGFALGGGCELVLACDLAIASEGAVLGQPEIDLGIIPGAGGTQRLKKRVGIARAKELIFTGRSVKALEALEIGLVDRVVPADKLREEAASLAGVIAKKPAVCIEEAKKLINSGTFEKEMEAFATLFARDERKILMDRFLKKKKKRKKR